jgi:hypothetical protein
VDLNTITVADFKALFVRDFPYLPVWSDTKLYNKDTVVYYEVTELFYRALDNGVPVGTVPTNATYWVLYPGDIYNYVLDSDIIKAFAEAQQSFNQALFTTDPNITLGYLYLSAHFLVNDINTANAGLQSSGINPVNSRTVGSVSESYFISDYYLNNPLYLFYNKTGYGQKYLSMILPNLVGNVGVVCGTTLP